MQLRAEVAQWLLCAVFVPWYADHTQLGCVLDNVLGGDTCCDLCVESPAWFVGPMTGHSCYGSIYGWWGCPAPFRIPSRSLLMCIHSPVGYGLLRPWLRPVLCAVGWDDWRSRVEHFCLACSLPSSCSSCIFWSCKLPFSSSSERRTS